LDRLTYNAEVSELVPAEAGLLDHILDGTHQIWADGLARMPFGQFWRAQKATPWGGEHLSRWALVDDGDVLASTKLYELDATLEGRAIRVAGLGAVFTQPAHRQKGAAREVIERVLEHAASRGADLALLFSEIGPDYYARLGFEPLPLPDLTLRVVEDSRRGAPATMVRAGDVRDYGDIVAMDAARAEPFRFHLRRDRDLVHYAIAKQRLLAGLGPEGAREVHFFIAEEGASAAAYVVIAVKDGVWTIDSCGDRDPAGARLGAILQVLIAREPSRLRPVIRAWWPETLRPPQIAVVNVAPSKDVAMIRPITAAGRPSAPIGAGELLYWRGDAF
jgi:predicted N-acetyltransferase YhbS